LGPSGHRRLARAEIKLSAMNLDGVWRAMQADDQLRRSAVGMSFDDSAWPVVQVPGHWRHESDFADSDGPLIYRTSFTHNPAANERSWIVFDGIFYQADVWLDGAYIGDPEGYFFPHSFDVSSLARLSGEHVLAVEVACAQHKSHRGRRNITGVLQQWDGADPSWNPGGLWRTPRIETTGPVRIDRLRVLCRDANSARAHLRLHGSLDSDNARLVRLRTLVDGRVHTEVEQSLARGMNEVDWNIDIENPKLWWPRSLGEQHLTRVDVEVLVDGQPSHRRGARTGLREVAMQNWTFTVNGERLFLKGANLAPSRLELASADPQTLRRDVELAAEAGLDLLRVHGHIAPDALYDAADEIGMLLWQDFPLQWGYAREVRRRAVSQAEQAVFTLGHHPSILMWCGHNEPGAAAIGMHPKQAKWKSAAKYLAGQQLPSWNKNVLDVWVKRAFERADDTRPTIAHSGVMPNLPELGGSDSHLYFGWYHGSERDLPGFAASFPRMVRFVSEFGAQAVPMTADFIDAGEWPNLDWDLLESRYGLQRALFEQQVPPFAYATFEAWRDATQLYQATVLRHHIETLRRLKYRPAGGFCMFMLNDSGPMISWSVLDHQRVPKLGFQALIDACRPVIVVADRLPATVSPGQCLGIDIHIVNDLRSAIIDARLDAHLRWAGGEHRWSFSGDAGADDCTLIGTVQIVVPNNPGEMWLDLVLEAENLAVTNRDRTAICLPLGST
jgi:beta-mannosidase